MARYEGRAGPFSAYVDTRGGSLGSGRLYGGGGYRRGGLSIGDRTPSGHTFIGGSPSGRIQIFAPPNQRIPNAYIFNGIHPTSQDYYDTIQDIRKANKPGLYHFGNFKVDIPKPGQFLTYVNDGKKDRPIAFGENGLSILQYDILNNHPDIVQRNLLKYPGYVQELQRADENAPFPVPAAKLQAQTQPTSAASSAPVQSIGQAQIATAPAPAIATPPRPTQTISDKTHEQRFAAAGAMRNAFSEVLVDNGKGAKNKSTKNKALGENGLIPYQSRIDGQYFHVLRELKDGKSQYTFSVAENGMYREIGRGDQAFFDNATRTIELHGGKGLIETLDQVAKGQLRADAAPMQNYTGNRPDHGALRQTTPPASHAQNGISVSTAPAQSPSFASELEAIGIPVKRPSVFASKAGTSAPKPN